MINNGNNGINDLLEAISDLEPCYNLITRIYGSIILNSTGGNSSVLRDHAATIIADNSLGMSGEGNDAYSGLTWRVLIGLLVTLKSLLIKNAININNENELYNVIDDYFNSAIPFICIESLKISGNSFNFEINHMDMARIENDANIFENIINNNVMFVMNYHNNGNSMFNRNHIFNNQNRGFSNNTLNNKFGFNNRSVRNNTGMGGLNRNSFDFGSNTFDGSHITNNRDNHSRRDNGGFVSPYDKAKMMGDREKYNNSRNNGMIDMSKLNQNVLSPGSNKQKSTDRKRGVYWFEYNGKGKTNDGIEVDINFHINKNPDSFKNYREKYAPIELYPVNAEELSWDNGNAYLEVTTENGSTINEWIYTNNRLNPCWITWDKTTHKCFIDITEDMLPYQKFVELSEIEKMDIEKHRIPGSSVLDGIATTSLPNGSDCDISKQIKSLTLSDEEFEEQKKEILESGGDISDQQIVKQDEIIVDNECELIEQVLSKSHDSSGEPKLSEVKYHKTNLSFTKSNKSEILRCISKCNDLFTYKKEVNDKLFECGEYHLLNKLNKLVDFQYNKILVKLGVNNIIVSDVVNDHKIVQDNYIPDDLKNDYHDLVRDMLNNLYIDVNLKIEGDENVESKMTHICTNGTVVYINRLLSGLKITLPKEGTQAQKWVMIDKHSSNRELYNLCFNYLLNKNNSNKIGRDLLLLTADGVLLEVIKGYNYTEDNIYIYYGNI